MVADQPKNSLPLIEKMRKILGAIQEKDRPSDRTGQMEAFMGHLFELGLEMHRCPQTRQLPEVVDFLNDSAKLLATLISDIELFIYRTQDECYGSWEYDEWRKVCIKRSSLAFLVEIYGDTNFGEIFSLLDCENLDELMREKGQQEGYLSAEKIPSGIPTTHWWWWYPEEPPTYGQ